MKKIAIIGGLFLFVCTGAFAQNFRTWNAFHDGHKNQSNVVDLTLKRLLTKSAAKPAWIRAVENQVRKSTPRQGVVGGIITDYTDYQKNADPTYEQAGTVQFARVTWTRALHESSFPINRFKVRIPNPQEVSELSVDEIKQVAEFIRGTLFDNAVQEMQHYMVEVTLLDKEHPIYLLFNCYFREMYVVHKSEQLPGVPLHPF